MHNINETKTVTYQNCIVKNSIKLKLKYIYIDFSKYLLP